jgi:phage gp46-like protein
MSDPYQGDPKVTITADGSEMTFVGGQPIMDQGLENDAFIGLFTKKGWCGNIFFSDPNQKIGSDFEDVANQTITVTSLNDSANAAQKALQPMIDSGVASNVIAQASNPEGKQLQVAVLIEPPGRDLNVLLLNKNGPNWVSQKIDPAYLKV